MEEILIGDIGAKALYDMLEIKDTLSELELLTLNVNKISETMYNNLQATGRVTANFVLA